VTGSFQPGTTWVVKVGSSLLTNDGNGIDHRLAESWVEDIAALRKLGYRIVLVSSGAVAEGMQRLGLRTRPHSLHELQAAAAVGQMGLVQMYESAFKKHSLHTAQVLLTHDDLRSRERYLNAKSTLNQLLDLGVIPVINENDTVVTDEIQFGDNDTLAALVANLIQANTLLLLTDQAGLLTDDPRSNPGAELVLEMSANDARLDEMAGGSSSMGRGGMVTKIRGARIASRSGAHTVIASGREPQVIKSLASGIVKGTLLKADRELVVARKQWLAALPIKGKVTIDEGACKVLEKQGRSLLPVGAIKVEGDFSRGDSVVCCDMSGTEIARGLVNYNARDAAKIVGLSSEKIEAILGYIAEEELIHRDNLVFL
jgi:glutamate 5-kinase